jgi:hypothetical protein
MTDLSLMIWFLATALVTITVLTVGTLAAAGMLTRRDRHESRPPAGRDRRQA